MGNYLRRSYDVHDKIHDEFTMKPVFWDLFGIIPVLKIKKTVKPKSIKSVWYLFYVLPVLSFEKEYEPETANA